MKSYNPTRLLCVAMVLAATVVTFRPALKLDFVNYDDPTYVTENPVVRKGLSTEGLRWALSATVSNHWHPVTWLSHMLDVSLFQLNPAGHHASSILIHALNAILIFLLADLWTARRWQSLLASLLFSIHPLRVETVAWVADRKDLLGTLFLLLGLLAYTRYAQRPNAYRYLFALLIFALGLMSKALLVVTPLILLFLDYWPLRRMGSGEMATLARGNGATIVVPFTWKRALIEKIPLLGLSAGISVLTVLLQDSGGNLQPLDTIPLSFRLSNGLWSYVWYIWKGLAPWGLSVFYPLQIIPLWKTGVALLFLIGVTFATVRFRTSHPYFLVGWGWYLVGLIPVLGIVQVGSQARADRYSYLPLIGLCIAVALAVGRVTRRNFRLESWVIGVATAYLLTMASLTYHQVLVWKNSQLLFEHAIRWNPENYVAHNNLAVYFIDHGQTEKAVRHLEEAVGIAVDYPEAYYNLGYAHLKANRISEATEAFSTALTLRPSYPEAHDGLGLTFYAKKDFPSALEEFNRALEFRPDFTDALVNRGAALIAMERQDEAVLSYQKAAELLPHDVGILQDLADTLLEMGRLREAAAQYLRILHLEPNRAQARKSFESLVQRMAQRTDHQNADRKSADQ